MKIFIYKFVIILIGFFLLFEFTIGSKIKTYERTFMTFFSKSEIESVKTKVRKEMKAAINKDVYLNADDAKLIGQFIKKVQKELDMNESD